MNSETKQIQLILNAPVGPLTDARKHAVAEILGPTFQQQQTPLANAVVFVSQSMRQNVFLADAQLNLTHDGDHLHFEAPEWSNTLTGLRDALLLDDKFNVMIQMITHVESNASSTEQTVRCFGPLPEEEMRNRFAGLRGIGLRINYELALFTCDLRVEPFFQDPGRFFLQLNAAGRNPVNLERIVEDANGFHEFMTNEAVQFLEKTLTD